MVYSGVNSLQKSCKGPIQHPPFAIDYREGDPGPPVHPEAAHAGERLAVPRAAGHVDATNERLA